MESMFDEITENAPDGKEVTERNEFRRACDAFVVAEKKFCKINLSVRLHKSADAGEWFPALKQRYATRKECGSFSALVSRRLRCRACTLNFAIAFCLAEA